VGAVAVYQALPGFRPVREAVFQGAVLSLGAFLIESLVGLATRLTGRTVWPRVVALGLVLFLCPLVALHRIHTVPKRSPAAWGLDFEEVRFRSQAPDGLLLGGWLVPHPQARGNVIFCHGHGRNRGHVSSLLPVLHSLRLNVLTFDFRGHGDSPGHTLTFGHREVGDLLGAAAFLRERFPGRPLLVIGVSYGAAVTLQALSQLSDVAGVWSEGSFSRLSNVVEKPARLFALVPAGLRRGLLSVYDSLGWIDCGFHVRDINPIDRLAGVRVPIYFCHARQDELVPFAEGEALYAAYTGPKEHWWVEATHYNVRQRHRDEYLRRLRSFLESCLSHLSRRRHSG
jgi:fermentation-respiration switch protein FrsA (DUF1100 family)